MLEEHLDQELDDWNVGRFAYQGRYLRLHWIDEPEAPIVRREYGDCAESRIGGPSALASA